jgi:chromosome partitioning protein
MPARTYVALNRKGGVGKTSTCFHVGGELARRGQRVLLIDIDPQRNLTDKLLMDPATGEVPDVPYEQTVAALFDPEAYVEDMAGLVRPTRLKHIALLPGAHRMEHLNMGNPATDGRQLVLRDFIEGVRDRFDFVICDCPPNIMIGSWAAMAAGDGVIVPLQAEDFGAMGLKLLNESLVQVRRECNPGLALLGYLLMMYDDKSPLHKAYAQTIRDSYPGLVLETSVPLSRDLKMAVTTGQPMTMFKPKSKAAKVIQALCDELLARDATAHLREVA